jgi:hypothetical protein
MFNNSTGFTYGHSSKSEPDPKLKGVEFGNCNRTSCQSRGAIWYNHSTQAYYCTPCARNINELNRMEAMRLYGHDLCTLEK